MSARAQILSAMFAILDGIGAARLRNASLPASVPDGGLVVMRDGTPDDPKVYFGADTIIEVYRHPIEIEIFSEATAPEAEIYGIIGEIRAAVDASPSLDGLVDTVTVGDAKVEAVPTDDGAPLVAGVVQIILSYTLVQIAA